MNKQLTLHLLRRLNLLPIVEKAFLFKNILVNHSKNKTYSKEHNVEIPPYSIMFDAYNHCRLDRYHESGLEHAKVINELILKYKNEKISVCEWGCGAARIIQHLKSINPNIFELIGTDYNHKTIDWCTDNIKGIRFIKNDLHPPLSLADNSVDVLYCLSVFTHLSEDQHYLWINEIKRVLKPNGLLIASFHGTRTFSNLFPNELELIKNDKLVIRDRVKEGSKFFTSYHSDGFLKYKLLADFKSIRKIEMNSSIQDIWCCEIS